MGDSQERIKELEKKVEELEAQIKTLVQTHNKYPHLGNTPEEQIILNQGAMDWAKERLQTIKDKLGDD